MLGFGFLLEKELLVLTKAFMPGESKKSLGVWRAVE